MTEAFTDEAFVAPVLGEWAPKFAVLVRIIVRRRAQIARYIAKGETFTDARYVEAVHCTELLLAAGVAAVERRAPLPEAARESLVVALEDAVRTWGGFLAPLHEKYRRPPPAMPELSEEEARAQEALADLGYMDWVHGRELPAR